jgi:hypothetical protein
MDERIKRFKLCDLNFYPYLSGVIERLPEEVRHDVLDDTSFQILTDDEALNSCVLRYRFSEPVKTLVYLNTNLLKEAKHHLIYTIASEIAHYTLSKRHAALDAGAIEALLRQWGFEDEVAAARSDQRLCESKGYKVGYDWAKKQDRNYLMQHFGIYYDAWNRDERDTMPGKTPRTVSHRIEPAPILDNIIRLKQSDAADSCRDKIIETPSLKQEIMAGIMAAMRELSLKAPSGGSRLSA